MASLRTKLVYTGLLFSAVIMKVSIPQVAQLLPTRLPVFNGFVISWFRGPYLYLVMNCIIVSIVASSKLQHQSNGESDQTSAWGVPPKFDERESVSSFDGDVPVKLDEVESNVSETVTPSSAVSETPGREEPPGSLVVESRDEEDHGESNQTQRDEKMEAERTRDSAEERASLQPEETLDSMWKTITDGHEVSSSTHLRKSDTWETQMKPSNGESPAPTKMKKLETFGGEKPFRLRKSCMQAKARKLKREQSLSQEELNRRVEAFINKFNEEMRLQRKKSLNNLKKMMNVSRGSLSA